MRYLFIITTIFFATFAAPTHGAVNGNQYGQYGNGSPAAGIMVDKVVSRGEPTKGSTLTYVDNFSPSDARFVGGQRVYFQIKVKNISNNVLTNVQMSDVLPEYIDAIEGPGDYDTAKRLITWTYSELRPGEERTERLILQIKPQDQLPSDRGTFCVSNKATGRSGDTFDEDTSQFCIEKKIALTTGGVPDIAPKAGADFGLIFGALNVAGLGAGIYLRRRT